MNLTCSDIRVDYCGAWVLDFTSGDVNTIAQYGFLTVILFFVVGYGLGAIVRAIRSGGRP